MPDTHTHAHLHHVSSLCSGERGKRGRGVLKSQPDRQTEAKTFILAEIRATLPPGYATIWLSNLTHTKQIESSGVREEETERERDRDSERESEREGCS